MFAISRVVSSNIVHRSSQKIYGQLLYGRLDERWKTRGYFSVTLCILKIMTSCWLDINYGTALWTYCMCCSYYKRNISQEGSKWPCRFKFSTYKLGKQLEFLWEENPAIWYFWKKMWAAVSFSTICRCWWALG